MWRECRASTKKCINCYGDHSTLSMKCQKKKEKINKRKESQTLTYSEIIGKRIIPSSETHIRTELDSNTHAKTFA